MLGGVDDQVAEAVRLVGRLSRSVPAHQLRPAELSRHPRLELPQLEWLHQVVVRAAVERHHQVGRVRAGTDDDDRRDVVNLAHRAAHLEAAHLGQHEVKQNERRPFRAESVYRLPPVADEETAITQLIAKALQHAADVGVIFDDQDEGAAGCYGFVNWLAHMAQCNSLAACLAQFQPPLGSTGLNDVTVVMSQASNPL